MLKTKIINSYQNNSNGELEVLINNFLEKFQDANIKDIQMVSTGNKITVMILYNDGRERENHFRDKSDISYDDVKIYSAGETPINDIKVSFP